MTRHLFLVGILLVLAVLVALGFAGTLNGPGPFLRGLFLPEAPVSSINNIDWKEYRTNHSRYIVIRVGLKQPQGKKWLVYTLVQARVTDARGRDYLASCYNSGGQTWNEMESYPSDVFASFFIDVSDLDDPHLSGLDITLLDFDGRLVDRVAFPRSFDPPHSHPVGTLRAEYRAGVSFEVANTPAVAKPPGVNY